MVLFANGAGFWDWAIKFMEPGTLAQWGIILGLILKHLRDEYNKYDVKNEVTDGNNLTKAVIPAVSEKVDSVTRQAVAEATETKKENQDTVKKAVIEQARSNEKIIETVKTLATTIKGDDGTCVTGRLKKLEDQHAELSREMRQGQSEMKQSIVDLTKEVRVMTGT